MLYFIHISNFINIQLISTLNTLTAIIH